MRKNVQKNIWLLKKICLIIKKKDMSPFFIAQKRCIINETKRYFAQTGTGKGGT